MKTLADMKKEYDALERQLDEIKSRPDNEKHKKAYEERYFTKDAMVANAKKFFEKQDFNGIVPCNIIGYANEGKKLLEEEKCWNDHFQDLYDSICERYSRYTPIG